MCTLIPHTCKGVGSLREKSLITNHQISEAWCPCIIHQPVGSVQAILFYPPVLNLTQSHSSTKQRNKILFQGKWPLLDDIFWQSFQKSFFYFCIIYRWDQHYRSEIDDSETQQKVDKQLKMNRIWFFSIKLKYKLKIALDNHKGKHG